MPVRLLLLQLLCGLSLAMSTSSLKVSLGRVGAVSVQRRSLSPKKLLGADLIVREHFLEVPLDYADRDGAKITVFVRELVKASRANASLPFLLYQQGGPGFPSGRPSARPSGWQKCALEKYRILLLDQRGTGRSTPVTCAQLRKLPSDESAAEYLRHFRADSIVKDTEIVREVVAKGQKLSLLGQSYGGFVNLCYLSTYPSSLDMVLFTCGLGPVGASVDEVYRATFKRMEARNSRFYERYPEDIELIRDIVRILHENGPLTTPRGGELTARRFLQLGLLLGSSSGLERLHDLLEEAKGQNDTIDLSENFLHAVERAQESFETNPIYYLLHEPIYACKNTSPGSTKWSAERVQNELPQWDFTKRLQKGDEPLLLSGEMVYSWMADDYAWLKPLRSIADKLAAKEDWGPLYDTDVLRNSPVNCAALLSYDDIYVERTFSENVADLLGPNTRKWVTNEFQHSGLRDAPDVIFDRLHDMAKGDLTY